MTLEQEFTQLIASMSRSQNELSPRIMRLSRVDKLTHSRTVYSVGEALAQKGRTTDAQLGRGIKRDTSP